MSIQTQWLDEQHTTIHQLFDHIWSSDEFETQYARIEQLANSVEHGVSLIVELHDVDPVAALNTTRHDEFPHQLNSIIVINEEGRVTRSLLSLINRLTPPAKKSPIVIVSDLTEAYEVLNLEAGLV